MIELKFDARGLIPAIAQSAENGEILMQAYMNQEAIDKTMETGKVHYFSRSRNKLWLKGETSGHFQTLVSMHADCDGDSILVKVLQEGNACHTGEHSCFHNKLYTAKEMPASSKILYDIVDTIRERAVNPKEGSYTNYLLAKGVDKICKKVGEEASEVIIAAKNNSKEEIIYEVSDLFYHVLVLLEDRGVRLSDVFGELERRR